MTCAHCNDTGSLTKQLWGYLDCPHCSAAQERTDAVIWAQCVTPDVDPIDAWLIYQHGKTAAAPSTARGSMEQGSSA
jgi:hypothetical protein